MPLREWKVPVVAAVIGISGDWLLRGGQWRLGSTLWLLALITGVFIIGGRGSRERNLLLAGVALASLGHVLRDSPMLYVMDMLSVLCVGALLIRHGTGATLSRLQAVDVPRVGLLALVNTVGGAPRVLGRGAGGDEDDTQRNRVVRGLLIGAALAALPVAVVTALLASSDPVFADLLQRIFAVNLFAHLCTALLLAWIATGWLRASLGQAVGASIPEMRTPELPFVTVSVVLYALTALLAAYLITQARVLFGGETFLLSAAHLSLANYARRGFFEMILAAGIVLSTLVVTQWLLSTDATPAHSRYRRLAMVLLALVAALLASATTRITLYVTRFGLSVDRALAIAVIVWVLAALVVFAWSMLQRQSDRFLPRVLFVTVIWVASFNAINPEALVTHINVSRAAAGAPFDVPYHASLSADALPSLVRAAPRLGAVVCRQIHSALIAVHARRPTTARDWRSTNLAAAWANAWYDRGAPIDCP